jgi:hypothetical protein
MMTGRADATATLLDNGRVLLAGGDNPGTLSSAELYNPATRSWSPTGSLTTGRARHNATLLEDGRVLVSGNHHNGEVYSPATGTWAPTGYMVNWYLQSSMAAPLPDGRVLVAGGEYEDCSQGWEYCEVVFVNTAEIYTP